MRSLLLLAPVVACALAFGACSSSSTSAPPTTSPASDAGSEDASAPDAPTDAAASGPTVLATTSADVDWIDAYGDALYWVTSTGEVDVLDAKGARKLGAVALGRCTVAYAKGALLSDKTSGTEQLVTFGADGTRTVVSDFTAKACTNQGANAVVVGDQGAGSGPILEGVGFVGGAAFDFRSGVNPNTFSSAGATSKDVYVVSQNNQAKYELQLASFAGATSFSVVLSDIAPPTFSPMIADGDDLLWVASGLNTDGIYRFDAAKKAITPVVDGKKLAASGESLSGSFALDATSYFVTVTTSGSGAEARLLRVARATGESVELASKLVFSAPVALLPKYVVTVRAKGQGESEIIGVAR